MENHSFTKRIRVEYCRCDLYNRMTPTYLLQEAQQISMEHCDALGLGNDYLRKIGKVFLLAKVYIKVSRMPMGGEQLVLKTIPYLPVKAQCQRLTQFFSEEGELLAQVDSRWIFVDVQTFRIFRKLPEEFAQYFSLPEEQPDIRVPKSEDMAFCRRQKVLYSQIDTNLHMNNSRYADLICDCLAEDLTSGKEFCEIMIHYHNQAKLNEEIIVYQKEANDGICFKGMIDDQVCFESWVKLKER